MVIINKYIKKVYRTLTTNMTSDKSTESSSDENELPNNVEECCKLLKKRFNNSSDVVLRTFETAGAKAMVIYVDGMADRDLIDRDIISPLKQADFDGDVEKAIEVSQFSVVSKVSDMIHEVLDGNTALFYENEKKIIIIDLKHWSARSVETPDAESVVRGPKEGFTESIRTNTSMLRRKIKTPDLVLENIVIGKQTRTKIALAYIKGIVNEDVLAELKSRLDRIDCDAILDAGYIEQYVEDNPFSPIATVGMTQKPDKLAGMLLEGRVGVFCDGSPDALFLPSLFIENIQSPEDYYNRVPVSTIFRLIRLVSLMISVLLPGFYVAMVTFNQEMIPDVFLITLAAARERIPLPAGAEIFFMIIMFELLRESGTRLPRPVGSAISIVGALIIGDAAVSAGIVGAPAVIVIALTAVTSFIVPSLTEFVVIYRMLFLLLGGTMGLIGISAGLVIVLTQIAGTTSFGVPILSSFTREEMKDFVPRYPLKMQRRRPQSIAQNNTTRNKTP